MQNHFFKSLLDRAGPVTLTLVAISVLVTLATNFGRNGAILQYFVFSSYEILQGEVWRAVTPIFLHFPVMGIVFLHLLFNMMWLWDLGGVIEKRLSGKTLLGLTLIIGIFSNAVQYHFSGPYFGGMSGVVFGLLGYLWIRGKFDPFFGLRLNPVIVNFMLIWLLIGFTGLAGSVANAAHLSGLFLGGLFGFIAARTGGVQRQKR